MLWRGLGKKGLITGIAAAAMLGTATYTSDSESLRHVCGMTECSIAQAAPVYNAELSGHWTPEVKQAIGDLYRLYGKNSSGYDAMHKPYAVFDFDNTTSIMDVEEQLAIWQLDHLAFAVAPEDMENVLLTGIPREGLSLAYGALDGDGEKITIQAAISDAVSDYKVLYSKGWITAKGTAPVEVISTLAEYQDFRAKMRWLYDAIKATMDASVAYPWKTYWFTGMTPQEVYDLAYACDSYYGDPTKGQTWTKGKYVSPAIGKAGQVSVSYTIGVTVAAEMKQLYAGLSDNGFDIWINSASPLDVVRAARDYFQLTGITGIVAMTNKLDSTGRYVNEYDYDLHPQTQGEGKTLTIKKVIMPKYNGRGPAFCAMDSQGDFNFCTEFADTKEVLVLNRKTNDDAAICAGIAWYQEQKGISLAEANKNGDTKFILQGRNENEGRFWADSSTLLLGDRDKSFLSGKALRVNEQLLQGDSIKKVLSQNTKLKQYRGYKSM